jgi:mycofactocin precursor
MDSSTEATVVDLEDTSGVDVEDVAIDVLVEEVSIDGMCGVY